MMGAPATGKGWLIDYLRKTDENFSVLPVIDPDEIKTIDLKQDFENEISEGRDGSAYVHEEASYISKRVMDAYEDIKAEYIQDKVFHNYNRLIMEIQRLNEKGLKVNVVMSSSPKEDSYKRMIERGQRTGRFVPMPYFNVAHDNIENTFDRLVENLPDNVSWVRKFDTTNEIKLVKEIKR